MIVILIFIAIVMISVILSFVTIIGTKCYDATEDIREEIANKIDEKIDNIVDNIVEWLKSKIDDFVFLKTRASIIEFDKSRVYTAVNADELPIGSKCIFADTLGALSAKLKSKEYKDFIIPLKRIYNDGSYDRFDNGDDLFCFAYLIEPPAEPNYKPFESLKQLIVATKKHGETVKSLVGQNESTIIGMTLNNRVIIDKSFLQSFGQPYGDKVSCTTEELLYNFVFLSDNSPCGELVEE